jgi:hypothetical protein
MSVDPSQQLSSSGGPALLQMHILCGQLHLLRGQKSHGPLAELEETDIPLLPAGTAPLSVTLLISHHPHSVLPPSLPMNSLRFHSHSDFSPVTLWVSRCVWLCVVVGTRLGGRAGCHHPSSTILTLSTAVLHLSMGLCECS